MVSKNAVSVMRGAALWAATFVSVVTLASIGSAAFVSFTTTDYAYPRTGGTTNLNATMWNKLIDNVQDVGLRTAAITTSSWGRMGIWTADPSQTFHVAASNTAAQLVLERIGTGSGKMAIGADSNGFSVFDGATYVRRMTVSASWSVGIGTPDPAARFNVSADGTRKSQFDANEFFQFHGWYSWYGTFSSDNVTLGIGTHDISGDSVFTSPMEGAFMGTLNSVPMNFRIANVERVRIDTNGNVGIGTNAPGYKLDVNGTVNATTSCLGWSCLSLWSGIVGGSYTTATTKCAAVNNPATWSTTCPSWFTAVITGRGLCDQSDPAFSVTYLCVKN